MNILIIGANGLLGRNLVSLLNMDHKIYAFDKDDKFIKQKNVTILKDDLFSFNVKILPRNIDAVYYLAQSLKFRDFPSGAADVFEINIHAPFKIVDWAINSGIKKFFYASSGGVHISSPKPLKESSPITVSDNKGFYSDSKLCAEIILNNFSSFFESFSVLRPFFMYGPFQNETMLIPRLIANIINGNEIILNSKDGIKINPIFFEDAANSFKNLLKLKGKLLFNIAGNEIVSIRDLSVKIGIIMGKAPKFKVIENYQSDMVADIVAMKENLYIPKFDLTEGLTKTISSMLGDNVSNDIPN